MIAWLIASVAVAAFATAWLLQALLPLPSGQARLAQLDGLRGVLALCVVICHVDAWNSYRVSGHWELPSVRMDNLGAVGVCLFFALTGFLFFRRLLQPQAIDWPQLFAHRLRRLLPLYLFFVLLMLIMVAVLSHGVLREPLLRFAAAVAVWIGFTVIAAPGLNGIGDPVLISFAGTSWTLRYEWLFYAALPALALLTGRRVPKWFIALGATSLVAFAILPWISYMQLFPFAAGILTAYAVRHAELRRFAAHPAAGVLAVVLPIIAVLAFQNLRALLPATLLCLAFVPIAAGNSVFGLLTARPTRHLGQISYSLYLLHCPVLFLAYGVPQFGDTPTAAAHWTIALLTTPLLVGFCTLTYYFIEQPLIAPSSAPPASAPGAAVELGTNEPAS